MPKWIENTLLMFILGGGTVAMVYAIAANFGYWPF